MARRIEVLMLPHQSAIGPPECHSIVSLLSRLSLLCGTSCTHDQAHPFSCGCGIAMGSIGAVLASR